MPELVPALDRPTPTADRKIAAYRQRRAQRGGFADLVQTAPREYTIPGVDTAALSREFGMANAAAPKWLEATFQAPLGCTAAQFEKIRFAAIAKFIKAMKARGYDPKINEAYRPRVSPGVYPAQDLESGFALLDRREMIIGMWFTFRNPKPVRLELPPHLLREYTVKSL